MSDKLLCGMKIQRRYACNQYAAYALAFDGIGALACGQHMAQAAGYLREKAGSDRILIKMTTVNLPVDGAA